MGGDGVGKVVEGVHGFGQAHQDTGGVGGERSVQCGGGGPDDAVALGGVGRCRLCGSESCVEGNCVVAGIVPQGECCVGQELGDVSNCGGVDGIDDGDVAECGCPVVVLGDEVGELSEEEPVHAVRGCVGGVGWGVLNPRT